MDNSSIYIIKFAKDITDLSNPSKKIDAFLEIDTENEHFSNFPILSVRTLRDKSDDNNNFLLYKFLTGNTITTEFNDREKSVSIEYQEGYTNSINLKSLIEFDSNSSSAYNDFKENYEKLLVTKIETQYYKSGRLKYIGQVVEIEDEESVKEGEGTLYYDSSKKMIKYKGGFEENEFDGSGEFLNLDGNVKLKCNNISCGIPINSAKLLFKFKDREEIVNIQFEEIWNKFHAITKQRKLDIVSSDTFVDSLAELYWEDSEKTLEQILFEDKLPSEQNIELWNLMNTLKSDMKLLSDKLDCQEIERKNEFFVLYYMILTGIGLNLIAIMF